MPSCAAEYIQAMGGMLYDEPIVRHAVALLQAHCLAGGLEPRWGARVPTPAFGAHIRRHYLPFCEEAIVAALAVGFVPYRLRKQVSRALYIERLLRRPVRA